MAFSFDFERSGGGKNLSKADTIIQGRGNRMLRDIGTVYSPVLKAETPRRSGKLANTTRFQIVGANTSQALEVRQGARTPDGDFYGGFVRRGTRPHEIRPKKIGGVLAFMGPNGMVFARKVNHPGTKANPYHKRALTQTSDQIDGIKTSAGIDIATELME